ncbi:Aste57867_915 [Aphanomyces stellatus]|uniref:Aste57867_915 protein n=1 Tax=Aphanomyces stellatus TaxID=120398 RepID=A0A485K3U7_9STRA|nr:hypothetical protein As57867_000914 [Aphanomyces stellatus]VFT78139.1 Aste57867_915 [Aphanomyces stellatus]
MKLPLPTNYFKCPPLAPDDVDRFMRQAHATAMQVVDKALVQRTDTISWSLLSDDRNGLQIYRGMDLLESSDRVKLCVGVAEVAGTIDEVVELFRNDTTTRAKAYVARFGRGLLDSANLYTLASPTLDRPNDAVAINWTAFQSPIKPLVMPRDGCYLEGHFEFRVGAKRGWVRSVKSLQLPCCPDMQQSHGLVRLTQLGAGHVFIESDRPGYLRLAYVVHTAFNVGGFLQGAASDWAIEKAIKRRCASLLDINTFLRENRLATGPYVTHVVPRATRRQCFLCQKTFGLFVSKSNCVKCGEVFCSACNREWSVPVGGGSSLTRIRACTKCSVAPSSGRPMDDDALQSTRSWSLSSSTTSAVRRHSLVVMGGPIGHATSPRHQTPPSPKHDDINSEAWIEAFIKSKSLLQPPRPPPDWMLPRPACNIFSPTQLARIESRRARVGGTRRLSIAPEDERESAH